MCLCVCMTMRVRPKEIVKKENERQGRRKKWVGKRAVHVGEKSGGSEGDVLLPTLPHQGGSGPLRAQIPAQTKDLAAS